MKAKEYKKIMAVVLSAGMIAAQPATSLASDTQPQEETQSLVVQETEDTDEGAGESEGTQDETPEAGQDIEEGTPDDAEDKKQAAAVDGSGVMVDISEKVLLMLTEGSIYQDENTKILYDTSTKEKVDPVTGDRVKETAPGNKDEGKGENDGSTSDKGNGTGDLKEEDAGEDTAQEEPSHEETANEENTEEAEAAEEAAESNATLVSRQTLIQLPDLKQDFRFWTVARVYSFAKNDLTIKEETSDTSRDIGRLKREGLLYILQDEGNGWLYVESGTVRGFVKSADVFQDEEASAFLKKYQEQAKAKAEKEKQTYKGIEGAAATADQLVAPEQNEAFLHTHSTVNRTVADKKYALTTVSFLNIREGKDADSRIIGTLKADSLCYILADENQEWVYVESGDVRGFIDRKYLKMGQEVDAQIEEDGEDTFPTAAEIIKPEQNKACYYTMTSVKSGVPGSEVRASLVEFAAQFIGNAYVWGGTSLTDGADCSGFVQSVYKEYGYTVPRVAEDQAQYGTKIAVEDAQPGDLIFYAKDGYIHHVVIYAGDGKTVEAMGSEYGIVQGNVDTSEAVWATRVLDDRSFQYTASDIGEVNATEDMYGESLGDFELTYYCSCEICCDVQTGITATGTAVVEGRTIAVDPSVIPYGTQVIIGGHVFTAEDCGGAIKQNHIDIYVNDHERALAMGVNKQEVFLVN